MTLDLLRGIAALAVMIRHFPWPGHVVPVLPSSFLAVDLFFLLSGYVLAATYASRLRGETGARLTPWRFMALRLLRMYPLYLLGLALALVATIGTIGPHAPAMLGGDGFVLSAIANLFFLPAPAQGLVTQVFPFNFPAWSLFWELAVNAMFAFILLRLTWPLIATIIAGCFVAVAAFAIGNGTLDSGSTWNTFAVGGLRCGFAFFAGVALVWLPRRFAAPQVSGWVPAALLIAALAAPESWGPLPALVSIAVLFPLAVWLGASATLGPRSESLGHWLGWLSYPVYVLQIPVLFALSALLFIATGESFAANLPRDLALYCSATIIAALIAGRWFDQPVRTWISARMRRRTIEPKAQTAP